MEKSRVHIEENYVAMLARVYKNRNTEARVRFISC